MKIADLTAALEPIAPLAYAEEWDNVGLLAGDPDADVARVLLTIDCTLDVLEEAERGGCSAIVAYHPPIFRAIKRITRGSLAYEIVRRGLAVYSPHTALDAAHGGTNDVLADALEMTSRAPIRRAGAGDDHVKLVTFVPEDAVGRVSEALWAAGAGRIGGYGSCSFRTRGVGTFLGGEGTSPAVGEAGRLETVDEVRLETVVPLGRVDRVVGALRGSHPYEEPAFDLVRVARPPGTVGMGRIGDVAPAPRSALVARIKARLGLSHVLVAGPSSGEVARVAVCAGSAGELLDAAIAQGAELILAGEVRHHDALAAAARGVTVVCALHSNSERVALPVLAERLRAALPGVGVTVSAVDRDPFVVA